MTIQRRAHLLRCGAWLTGCLALGFALAGCGGFGPRDDGGQLTIDLRALTSQLSDRSSGSTSSPASTSGPAASNATTPVKSVILGALVIDFQDTPLDPAVGVNKNVRDSIKTAAQRSVKFLTIVQLPSSDASISVAAPPPGTPHWQLAAVGTRDTINAYTDISDNSPIYYGFNVDSNNKPFFLSSTNPPATVTITLLRACFVNTPPNGCGQFLNATTAVVSGDVEITSVQGINADQSLSANLLSSAPWTVRVQGAGACGLGGTSVCPPGTAQTSLPGAVNLTGYIGVAVTTTHQMNPGETSACKGGSTETTADTAAIANCTHQIYKTIF